MKPMEPRRNVLAFEQQPRESDKAFAAFSLYLSLGLERSLAAVAHRLQKSVTLLGRWSAKFDWPARVRAHAAHLALVERQATEATLRSKAAEWLTRHLVDEIEGIYKVAGHVRLGINKNAGQCVDVDMTVIGTGGECEPTTGKVGFGRPQPLKQVFAFDLAQGVRV